MQIQPLKKSRQRQTWTPKKEHNYRRRTITLLSPEKWDVIIRLTHSAGVSGLQYRTKRQTCSKSVCKHLWKITFFHSWKNRHLALSWQDTDDLESVHKGLNPPADFTFWSLHECLSPQICAAALQRGGDLSWLRAQPDHENYHHHLPEWEI